MLGRHQYCFQNPAKHLAKIVKAVKNCLAEFLIRLKFWLKSASYHKLLFTLKKKKRKTLRPLFMYGAQLPQGYSHFEEAVYLLQLS